MSFVHFQEHSSPLLKNLNMLKFEDIIKMINIQCTHNNVKNNNPEIFGKYFDFKEMNHQHSLINNRVMYTAFLKVHYNFEFTERT